MTRLRTVATALFLACSIVLLGCEAAPTGTVVFEETVNGSDDDEEEDEE